MKTYVDGLDQNQGLIYHVKGLNYQVIKCSVCGDLITKGNERMIDDSVVCDLDFWEQDNN